MKATLSMKLNVSPVLLLALFLPILAIQGSEKDAGKETVVAAEAPTADWMEWAKWAEKRHPVTDELGHGPDIGGDEWAAALGRRLQISDKAGHGPDIGSVEWRQAVEKKLKTKAAPVPKKERQLLSSHDTMARFTGLNDHQCLGRTSLCPDRRGHSGKLATFSIVKYLGYEKPGEYGDPKQERFQILIEDNIKNQKVPAAIHEAISALTPGALVHLRWDHDYVTQGGSCFPERTILELSIVNDK
jgi:hypothetical protein